MTSRIYRTAVGFCLAVLCFGMLCAPWSAFAASATSDARPRVIATTDGEIDDRCSMVRFLLYANEWNIQGIVHSSSKYHWKGDGEHPAHSWQGTKWLDTQLDAYAHVYPNLRRHDANYPSPEYLRAHVIVGNVDLEGDMRKATPGSDRIVEVLLDSDDTPVWLQAWGGSNTIARALKTIKDEHPDSIARVSKKARIYLITEQDKTFQEYIRPEWPEVQVLLCRGATFGAIAYDWRNLQPPEIRAYFDRDWMMANILENHGPLCALYEAKEKGFRSEGDSPSFLHVIDTGLRSSESPAYGGWGGRFAFSNNTWKSVDAEGAVPHSVLRWAISFQNDWATRADWCVKDIESSNHPPVARVAGELNRTVRAGDEVKLVAEAVPDPDGDSVAYRWWHFLEAGSASAVSITNATSRDDASFVAPQEPGRTIHVLLEVTDNGTPALTRWQRIIFTIE